MKKVYQTIHGKGKGNCLVASIASLLELKIEDVPHFNEKENWFNTMYEFMKSHGYEITNLYNKEAAKLKDKTRDWYEENKNTTNHLEELKNYEGVDGYFEAAVYSPKYYNTKDSKSALHSVVIDKNFNIFHDPEEDYNNIKEYPRAKELGYNGIVHVTAISKIK